MTAETTFSVRQAVLADLDLLAPMLDQYRQFYQRPSDLAAARSFLMDRFNHGESVLFIAQEGDTVLGFAQMYPSFSSVSLKRAFVFNDLFVAQAGRRRGVGQALIAAAAAYATALGARFLTLSTAKTNEDAQALYRSTGWQREETFVGYTLMLQD
ncbi:GNAT family N-acetyltransferase [Massilia sp. H6]|uniref:GNAT family N-acetyltransferase n=1 Tax=Massilia sp. H6 TaxID=2970464 RepID=UPI0021670B49|nr:GNAT family N-acetyltransferase [Massilia sp. H6]UVW28519.1 GNAT family N-acetyltransferase [Massilia sp. H6]